VRKNLSHKTALSRRDASGMGFSMKKEQDLDPKLGSNPCGPAINKVQSARYGNIPP
jgi:hypothetical protein